MKIDCYLSPDCGSEKALRENIAEAILSEKIEAEVNFFRIDATAAAVLGLHGSPSVLINGKDIQSSGTVGFS
ncbi:MAG: hypothetical protein AB1442_15355 [Nitrospirota bacterium]